MALRALSAPTSPPRLTSPSSLSDDPAHFRIRVTPTLLRTPIPEDGPKMREQNPQHSRQSVY